MLLAEQHNLSRKQIGTEPRPCCLICGSPGELLYLELRDRLFGAPGTWNVKRCPRQGCGLLWLDPTPSEEDLGLAYLDYFTHNGDQFEDRTGQGLILRLKRLVKSGYLANRYGYGRDCVGWWTKALGLLAFLRPIVRTDVDRAVMYLPAVRHGPLLDIGCGNGIRLVALRQQGWDAEGIDLDEAAVQPAKNNGLPVRLGSLTEQHYPDAYFDAITMSHAIEHVRDPVEVMAECRRILKAGGRLSIVTPNGDSWCHRRFAQDWRGLEPPRHLQIFNLATLKRAVKKAGFEKVAADTLVSSVPFIFLASRSLRKTGHHDMTREHTRLERAAAAGVALIEWILRNFNPQLGEEIRLLAQK